MSLIVVVKARTIKAFTNSHRNVDVEDWEELRMFRQPLYIMKAHRPAIMSSLR